ncbi:serine hydrolase domain-containing protein [Rhizohabitans arisaemae]|uniref:serine hydrolase domain-containing protein n=1 Tax=Rhizohabitans arisaemae TaxID=2720610 RepID=UPI0024B0B342|nr:serine hydrolase domain-containing protein [Rhizohabitans arisaemae]
MSTSPHSAENSGGRAPRASHPVAVTALAAGLLAGTIAPGVAAADSRVAVSKDAAGQDRPELQKAVQAIVDAGFLGVQARVNDERGEWAGSAGRRRLGANAKPPADGRFRIGSSTKPFIATLVLQLVADGEIGLDAPVADHLPEFKLDRRITVRMLLQNTSGLYNYTGEFRPDGSIESLIPSTGKEWADARFKTYRPEELVRAALSKPARFEPGTNWSYSNTNYTLALLLIEKVTGNPIAEEMKRRILGPLKLRGTVVPGTSPELPRPHLRGYFRYQDATDRWKVIDVTRQNPSMTAGAGDMISTTRDLHTFFSALNGGRLLSAKLLAEMRKPHPKSVGPFGGYGLGTYVQDLGPNCGTVLHHNGSTAGGYVSVMYGTPDGKKTLTASITYGDAAPDVAQAFPKARDNLLKAVFCGERAGAADEAKPAQ